VKYAALLLLSLPALAQDSPAFPRFSITAGAYNADFSTDVRVDPLGTDINLERDLALERSPRLNDLNVRWRPFARHELAASYLSASRDGSAVINRDFRFNGQVYPVNATATTSLDTKKWEATYTYWLQRSSRSGFGLMIGAAELSFDSSVSAQTPTVGVTVSGSANTKVPVALGGAQLRVALTNRVIAEASAAALPRVKFDVYSGRATSANARIEFRVVSNLGVGVAYNYFNIDGTVTDPSFGGRLKMTVKGGEGFVRLAF